MLLLMAKLPLILVFLAMLLLQLTQESLSIHATNVVLLNVRDNTHRISVLPDGTIVSSPTAPTLYSKILYIYNFLQILPFSRNIFNTTFTLHNTRNSLPFLHINMSLYSVFLSILKPDGFQFFHLSAFNLYKTGN